MINYTLIFGKEIVYNYFDRNRFFAGFKANINKHDNLQFGIYKPVFTNYQREISIGIIMLSGYFIFKTPIYEEKKPYHRVSFETKSRVSNKTEKFSL